MLPPTPITHTVCTWENLDPVGLRLQETHRLIVCMSCGVAWTPGNVVNHLKNTHQIVMTPSQKASLTEAVEYFRIPDHPREEVPLPRGPPIEGLAIVDDGHCCNVCNYAVPLLASFTKHWNHEHPTEPELPIGRFHIAPIQTFYHPTPQKYFEVDPSLLLANSDDPYHVFCRQLAAMPPLPIPVPVHDRETPVLLQLMQWHTHLAAYIAEKSECLKIVELLKLPHYTANAWYSRISVSSSEYIDTVSALCMDTPLAIRSILKECPRYAPFNMYI